MFEVPSAVFKVEQSLIQIAIYILKDRSFLGPTEFDLFTHYPFAQSEVRAFAMAPNGPYNLPSLTSLSDLSTSSPSSFCPTHADVLH